MDAIYEAQERTHKRRGLIGTIIFYVLVSILLFLKLLTYPDPPPGQEGILVNLGEQFVGQGDENAGPAEPVISEPDPPQEPVKEVQPTTPPPPQPEPEPQKEVVTTEDPDAVRLREEEKKKQQQQELERQKQLEEERQRQAELEAQRKAEEERKAKEAEANKLKDKIGGLFGDGKGKGNTGTPGNQGDPDGDPNAEKLEGISTGSGTVGGGLDGRGILASPRIQDQSQDQGIVVVRVCVDAGGSVVSAEFTQRGTTATSARLQQLAVTNAKKWKFSPGSVDRQCGTISYHFKVQ